MNRCVRIIFSLSFHLSKMTALECVQFLMERVGFNRANAEGEVRRSFNGSYPPIYQCAYMLGALQFYGLERLSRNATGTALGSRFEAARDCFPANLKKPNDGTSRALSSDVRKVIEFPANSRPQQNAKNPIKPGTLMNLFDIAESLRSKSAGATIVTLAPEGPGVNEWPFCAA
jgi:hypothetical protein